MCLREITSRSIQGPIIAYKLFLEIEIDGKFYLHPHAAWLLPRLLNEEQRKKKYPNDFSFPINEWIEDKNSYDLLTENGQTASQFLADGQQALLPEYYPCGFHCFQNLDQALAVARFEYKANQSKSEYHNPISLIYLEQCRRQKVQSRKQLFEIEIDDIHTAGKQTMFGIDEQCHLHGISTDCYVGRKMRIINKIGFVDPVKLIMTLKLPCA